MSLLDFLLGHNAQTIEQPITFAPLQPNSNLGQDGYPIQQNIVQNKTPQKKIPLLKSIQIPMPQSQTSQNQQINPVNPMIGADVSQQDYNNLSNQGMLPSQINPQYSMGLTNKPETTGLLQDLASGYKDNLTNGFNPDNLRSDPNKSIANKVGEGLGTVTRFLNSPAGRFALTAGLVGATGGTPLQSLAYGATAGVGNQQLSTQDKMYRKALEDNGIDTSNIGGYIDGDMYKNYSLGEYRNGMLGLGNKKLSHSDYNTALKGLQKQLSENILSPKEYTHQLNILNKRFEDDNIQSAIDAGKVGESNATSNAKVNKYLAPSKKKMYEAMPVIAGMNAGTNAGRLGLAQAEFEYKKEHPDDQKTQEKLSNLQNLHQDLQDFKQMFDTVPNPRAGNLYQLDVTKNKLRRNLQSLSTNEQAFETARQNLKFRILTSLDDSGKRINTIEMKSLDAAIPSLDMTYAQKQSSYKQLDRLLKNKYGITLNSVNKSVNTPSSSKNNDPLGIR